ncbi:MAG: elongation factor P [Porphyrobacter sp.]|nr:elongation factor P [Porphyrobacter sp.]
MKTRYIFLLVVSAAAAAALLPAQSHGQDRSSNRAASRPQATAGTANSGVLGILRHGNWECALPGDAGGDAYLPQPAEAFRIGTASSYENAGGTGIYLMRGTEVIFTRGPKKDERFRVLGENTLQKLERDGTNSKLICTRVGSGD